MKRLTSLSLWSFLVLNTSTPAAWGVNQTLEFTGDLEAFKENVKRIQDLPQTSDDNGYTVGVTVRLSDDSADGLDSFFEELKKIKGNIKTFKVADSPAYIANDLISALQDEGGFQKLAVLDFSGNKSLSGAPITFVGLEGLLEKTPSLQTLSLAKNDLSETMDCVLRGMLSSKNQLAKLELNQVNPTPQTLSRLLYPFMGEPRQPTLTLVLDGNPLGTAHMSIIQSLLSTMQAGSGVLEGLSVRNCQIPESSLADVVSAYLIQGSCAHLFCDDESDGKLVSRVPLAPIRYVLHLLKENEAVQKNFGITLIDPLERLKTLSEDNPGFKVSLKSEKGNRFLSDVDEFLGWLLSAERSEQEKKDQRTASLIVDLQEYFTDLWGGLPE